MWIVCLVLVLDAFLFEFIAVIKYQTTNDWREEEFAWALSLKLPWWWGRCGIRNMRHCAHTQEGERDQRGTHPLMLLFPLYSVWNCSTEHHMWRLSLPISINLSSNILKDLPWVFFFLLDGSRSCIVDNVNHHCSAKWSHPHQRTFCEPSKFSSPAQNYWSKNCYIQLQQTTFPLSSNRMIHRVEFAFTVL